MIPRTGSFTTLILLTVAGLSTFAYSSDQLHTYKGSVRDLLPERVGTYRKGSKAPTVPLGLSDAARKLKVRTEDEGAVYQSNNKIIVFGAMNFDSPENALRALRMLKSGLSSEQGLTLKNSELKKKGSSTVGERFELYKSRSTGRGEEEWIYWTNGSVVFSLAGGPERGIALKDLEQFEDSLPY